jgi:hypothetical protein
MRRFVGRRAESEQFREMLDRPPDDVRVLALHGPGGIGRTVLLRRLALEAVQLGRHVVEVSAEHVGTAAALAAAAVPAGERLVLFVDTVEHPGPLDEDWFRERFLTSLAPGSLVVLAGRQPPSLRWRTDPAWQDSLLDNPLLQAAFVVRRAGEPEQLLRDLIVRAVEAIGEGPRVAWQRAAVRATYLVGGRPQQAVARELSVSFSTYRRHLKRGVERVCWYLWEQEMTHVALSRGPSGGDSGVKAPG